MPVAHYAKTIIAILFAAVAVAMKVTDDNVLTTQEAIEIGLAVLGALGVYAVPNAKANDVTRRP